MEQDQGNLFGQNGNHNGQSATAKRNWKPLAFRARPKDLSNYCGQKQIFTKHPFLFQDKLPSLILHGPPGTGKTTLANILANKSGGEIYYLNAVLHGVADLKKIVAKAMEMEQFFGKKAILFIDEIHRFNKAQQDALLPHVEKGDLILIGATTENPKVSVNKALLSRVRLVELTHLTAEELFDVLAKTCERFDIKATSDHLNYIAQMGHGDARWALNQLELLEEQELGLEEFKLLVSETQREYDKNSDRHYDVISAFIKSMRGSDPDAALLWLAIMIDGGEDPIFIARRLIVFASEDVGNSDPQALSLAVAGLSAVQNIGLPEARINLAHVTTYLASTTKSNASYEGINAAMAYIQKYPTLEVPTHLRNQHADKRHYQYPHAHTQHFVQQEYAPKGTPQFYHPSTQGVEKRILERLKGLWQNFKSF